MVVQHNIPAMNANRLFGVNNSGLAKSLEKLSSGYAINRAGDNAAGLAVSEKMRSQIAGLTQGVKNAQDGISMIQTYEGALQETDAILQRMKTLATQAANGSYQNEVDRDAIQYEFDHLNDELNQIADTDFNGVVVMNGGQMADGLKAVDGKFDYESAERAPMQLSANDVNKVDYQLFDDTDDTAGVTKADTIWKAISDDKWDRKTVGAEKGPESVDVTLKFDKTANTWSVESANNGANSAKMEAEATDNGGFKLKVKGGDTIADVVLNTTDLKNGDTIVLTLNNPNAGIAAPTKGGAVVIDDTGYTPGVAATAKKAQDLNITVTIPEAITDDKMTEGYNKLYNALDGATVTTTYVKSEATKAGQIAIEFSDGAKLTASGTSAKFTLKDGTAFWAEQGEGKLEIYTLGDDGNSKGTTKLAEVGMTKAVAADDGAGTMKYKVGLEYNNFNVSKKPTVEVKSPDNSAVSKSNAYDQATAPLTYTDHIGLQTGARTKDLVDFTFKYSSQGMGDLKANMNVSSREDGLNTANLSLRNQKDANFAIDRIDQAINKVSMVRATFGATQNRLEHKIDNMNVTKENITSAESRIRDTNMAEEMTNFTKNQILSQASQAMLAQANQLPQGVLQLLG